MTKAKSKKSEIWLDEAIRFEADIPPTVNHLYASVSYWDERTKKNRCRRVLSKDGKAYKEAVGWIVKAEALKKDWHYDGGRISINITVVYGDRRRRDITNNIKVVEDAIAEVLGFDDSVVDSLIIRRSGVDPNKPHIKVVVSEYE